MAGPRFPVVTVRLDSLEIARGHDGLFRGAPEPVALIAVFGCGPSHARLLERRVARFRAPEDIPCTIPPRESVVLTPMLAEDDTSALVLAIGVELDGGVGLERLFGLVERSERLSGSLMGDALPVPQHLEELATHARTRAERIDLLVDGAPLAGGDDELVGASLTSLDGSIRSMRDARFALVASDERNDWTLRARIGIRVRPRSSARDH